MSQFPHRLLILLSAFCLSSSPLFADGGTLQFRKQAGPFVVTVFSAPVPLRAGPADISVLVQDGQDNSPVLDASVSMQLSKVEERTINAKATTSRATNKLLYASSVEFPSPGSWRLTVRVARGGTVGETGGDLPVQAEEAPVITYWLYFAVVPLGVMLFVLNQWLKKKRRPATSGGRPPSFTL